MYVCIFLFLFLFHLILFYFIFISFPPQDLLLIQFTMLPKVIQPLVFTQNNTSIHISSGQHISCKGRIFFTATNFVLHKAQNLAAKSHNFIICLLTVIVILYIYVVSKSFRIISLDYFKQLCVNIIDFFIFNVFSTFINHFIRQF